MRVMIQTTKRHRYKCSNCGKLIKFGEHYTSDKFGETYRSWHYPNCEHPKYGFGDDGMGRSYIV